MQSFVLLISTAISVVTAAKLVSIPFAGVEKVSLRASGKNQTDSLVDVPLENIDLAYLIDIQIGSPPQPFTLLLDTGSSSTWVPIRGCNQRCGFPRHSYSPKATHSFRTDNTLFSITYGEGYASGYYAQDIVTINNVEVPHVNFAVSDFNDGELTADGADGILGIGPDVLSTYNNPDRRVYPTLVTTMYMEGIIDHNVFSVYFQPISTKLSKSVREQRRINGEIVFGGVEDRHIASEVKYIPTTSRAQYKDYWAVDAEAITVGSYTKRYAKPLAAMIDTGSTLVFLPREIIGRTFSKVKGLQRDYAGQFIVPCNSPDLPDITITMSNRNYTITPEHYVIRAGALAYSASNCYTYLQESPDFVDAILGYGFLQQYVSVYDNENHRIGFADRA